MHLDSRGASTKHMLLVILGVVLAVMSPALAQNDPVGTYRSLAEALQYADVATTLILDKTPLESLPTDLVKLQNLRVLILHRNGLKNVPDELVSLKHLKAIYVGGSPALDFRRLIQVLSQLPLLEGIGLDDNNMHAVPDNIGSLKGCKRLGLSSNDLTTVPAQVSSLVSLESLDLYNNRLRELPPEIRELRSLKRIFVKDSGLSNTSVHKLLPDADLIEVTPPEIYLQLK